MLCGGEFFCMGIYAKILENHNLSSSMLLICILRGVNNKGGGTILLQQPSRVTLASMYRCQHKEMQHFGH